MIKQIKPKLQSEDFSAKYLVKSNNIISLRKNKNTLTFNTKISYLDETMIKEYVYNE
ncbi:UNVERIFIED_CONTAM: hypothetical protein O8I53_13625 [Campylobacter lari]